MADDSATTLVGSAATGATFDATTDGGGNRTLQSTPRTNGAIVSITNPLPTRTPDGMDAAEGTTTDVAWVSGAGTVISILKGIFGKLAAALSINITQVAGSSILTGAGTAVGAVRVAMPTDQSLSAVLTGGSVTISGTPPVASVQSGAWNVGAVVTASTATQAAGTIVTTGTYVSALAANASRKGGVIQNTSTALAYVYMAGTTAAQSAGTSPAVQLSPLDAFDLSINRGFVYQGAVSITGTAGATFVTIENT